METQTFWQLYRAYKKRVWSRAFSETSTLLGLNKTTIWIVATTVLSWLALWYFFKWTQAELVSEIVPVLAFVLTMIVIGAPILICQAIAAPVLIDRDQRRAIDRFEKLASASSIALSQPRGYQDNLYSSYPTPDSWVVMFRDLIIVNQSERDDVVTLKLWLPVTNDGLALSPHHTAIPPPPGVDIGPELPLLKGVENIPALRSATGNVFFKIPKHTLPQNSVPFYVLTITSQLNGTERGFNSLNFAEVRKPYPRTIDELNQQLASGSVTVTSGRSTVG